MRIMAIYIRKSIVSVIAEVSSIRLLMIFDYHIILQYIFLLNTGKNFGKELTQRK